MKSPVFSLEKMQEPEIRRVIIVKVFDDDSNDKFDIKGLLLPNIETKFQDI